MEQEETEQTSGTNQPGNGSMVGKEASVVLDPALGAM